MEQNPLKMKEFNIDDSPPKCAQWRNHMPKIRDQDTHKLYYQARKLWRSKIEWQFTKDELHSIFRDVDLAAKRGDWGARALLAKFYREGLGPLDANHILDSQPEKSIELVKMAVEAGQPWGYYDLGVAHEYGYGGVSHDKGLAWVYYLKAAELGHPDAQMALAEAYKERKRWDDEKKMLICAYQQQHGPAAYRLGTYANIHKNFSEAIEFYQQGTKFGSRQCAFALVILFKLESWHRKTKEERDLLMEIGIHADDARANRYRVLSELLEVNPDLRFGRLDNVLPLPPSELPDWGGIENAMDPEPSGPISY